MTTRQTRTVSVDGHDVRLTNLDKVLFAETGTTKAEVIDYYRVMAPLLVRHARHRPATLKRWVDGVGPASHPRAGFFQKDVTHAPEWVRTISVDHRDHTTNQLDVQDEATLIWAAQLAAIEVHVPQWRSDARGGRDRPDRIVFDLDPGPGVGLRECADVARILRDRLEELGIRAAPVTSGSKGIHLYARVGPLSAEWTTSTFARQLARVVARQLPELVVTEMAKSKREGRVFIDWSQNNPAKTTVSPYSLRGRPSPMVAAPRTWQELDEPDLGHLTLQDMLERLGDQLPDVLEDELNGPATDPRPTH